MVRRKARAQSCVHLSPQPFGLKVGPSDRPGGSPTGATVNHGLDEQVSRIEILERRYRQRCHAYSSRIFTLAQHLTHHWS
jgi:hypothetical protein